MRKIRKLEPAALKLPVKKRVAAYARVSSGKDESIHSLSAQISYYSGYIQNHRGWEYAGVYADEAVTGTKDTRSGFRRLLNDCRSGSIDMVLTKSISRFARNTVDLLETVRVLRELNVDVFFERENIHSQSQDGELMLTILASFAQEESRSVSENCKWRIRKNFQDGIPNTLIMLGYDMVNGALKIVPEEAKTVRFIFDSFLGGMGKLAIMKKLNEMGIKTKNGNTWCENAIYNTLRNEKYIGDMMLQKTFRYDHICKRKTKNRGELQKYYVTGSHDPIISRDTFDRVQEELKRRSEKYNNSTVKAPNYPFTGKIICGKCGKCYNRKTNSAGTKYERVIWICSTYNQIGKSACDARQIPEDILLSLTSGILNLSGFDKDVFEKRISRIEVPEHGKLTYIFNDQSQARVTWDYESRRGRNER